jgi:hypothetical protein
MMSVDQVLEFVRRAVDAERDVRRAMMAEPDEEKYDKLMHELDAMYEGAMRSGLSRPERPASEYESPEWVAAAASKRSRTIFALAHYQQGEIQIWRAWLGDFEVRSKGEGMRAGFLVTRSDEGFQIATQLCICDGCLGTGVRNEAPCGMCAACGWLHEGGVEWQELGAPLEIQRLEPPSNPRYAAGLDLRPVPEHPPTV